jgi:ATP-binding cassette subfamily B protein
VSPSQPFVVKGLYAYIEAQEGVIVHWNRFWMQEDIRGRDALKRVTWPLVRRVAVYARPYLGRSLLLLVVILAGTGLGLVTPLIFRELIDRAIPRANIRELNLLALALLALPMLGGVLSVLESTITARIGSGVI